MDEVAPVSTAVSALAARCDSAYAEWQALNRDPQCWSNPEKRRAMLSARIAYQDALSEYVAAVRAGQSGVGADGESSEKEATGTS